jgi:hypothetical protein
LYFEVFIPSGLYFKVKETLWIVLVYTLYISTHPLDCKYTPLICKYTPSGLY